MPKDKTLRYAVIGPGLDPEPSYADLGPAMSRSITAAEASELEATWYVRDMITGENAGFSEVMLFKGAKVTRTIRFEER